MGNSQSSSNDAPRPSSSSPNKSHHNTPSSNTPRRERGEPKIRDNLESKRTAAPPEPSLTQARGTSVSHKSRTAPSTTHGTRIEDEHVISSSRKGDNSVASSFDKPSQAIDIRDDIIPTKPVDVPIKLSKEESSNTSRDAYHIANQSPDFMDMDTETHYRNPPRMPLPIEEEIHTPGSPIIAPLNDGDLPSMQADQLDDSDDAEDVEEVENAEELDEHDKLSRKASGLSAQTNDEVSEEEDELPIANDKATVPVLFKWDGGGAKVYVTGSIFQWNRKAKLDPVQGQPGHFSATLYVRPGTHHVRFIVDNEMQTSRGLPTTVDFGNNLVNYIEVATEAIAPNIHTTEVTPATKSAEPPVVDALPAKATITKPEAAAANLPPKKYKPVDPNVRYTNVVPWYIVDLDKPEETDEYGYAANAIAQLPHQPSLPGFLYKSILNVATPMKDDNSVLSMPNHTMLNHLATSSIRKNVLAVSVTTRYKNKYVTTIMHQPAELEE